MPNLYPGNVGADATIKAGVQPVTQAAAAGFSLVGIALDRQGIESMVAAVFLGAVNAGTFTVDGKLQDSADNSTFADVVVNPQNPKVALTQMTTINSAQRFEIDLRGLRRYVRMVFTVGMAGGATGLGFFHGFLTGGAVIAPGGGVTQ